MAGIAKGRYRARMADSLADIEAARRLRSRAFRLGEGVDADEFDSRCQHVLIEDTATAQLVACFRLLPIQSGRDVEGCYSAQFYDLTALHSFDAPLAEVGRFCIAPEVQDPDIIRLAWAALTRFVDDTGTGMLIGCSSFQDTDPAPYAHAFALLKDRHLAPRCWMPVIKAAEIVPFDQGAKATVDEKQALRAMPPLLRTYLTMGGWVSDHAVIDRDLNTLHVFTGLEVSQIPAGRQRLLRQTAG